MTDPDRFDFIKAFDDPEHAARYADGPAKFMPGYFDLHRMTIALIRERAPADAHVLVHGAGGGVELEAFARANAGWSFVAVDPARAMLDQAMTMMGDMEGRVVPHLGYIDDAPAGPFDAATSLLTLHFLEADERRKTIAEIVRRLKPGAPFIAAHSSFPQTEPERSLWLDRYAAFAIASGVEPEMANGARTSVADMVPLLTPEKDEALLRETGLVDVSLFYAAFTWRGWIGYAP